MHDIMFAGKIIHLLKEKVPAENKKSPITINVVLGPFTHVTAESLRAAFDMLSRQEGFERAGLSIKKRKASIQCGKCSAETEIEAPVVTCPSCGADDLQLLNTEEFVIDSLEIG